MHCETRVGWDIYNSKTISVDAVEKFPQDHEGAERISEGEEPLLE